MSDLIMNWIMNHRQYLCGIAIGYALGHIPYFVAMAFHLAMKIPFIRAAVVANPKQAKAIVESIASELEKDIDSEAATKPQ